MKERTQEKGEGKRVKRGRESREREREMNLGRSGERKWRMVDSGNKKSFKNRTSISLPRNETKFFQKLQ